MTGITENDSKATAFEELRDRATRAGHAEGFASAIKALHDSLRYDKPLLNPTPGDSALDNPEATSFDGVWQHYATVGFSDGWTTGINTLIELLGWLPTTLNGLNSHISEMRLAAQDTSLPFDTPIEYFDFTVRSYNCLKREGIHYVGELLVHTEAYLLEIRNLGPRDVDEIKAKMAARGYQLAPSPAGFERP